MKKKALAVLVGACMLLAAIPVLASEESSIMDYAENPEYIDVLMRAKDITLEEATGRTTFRNAGGFSGGVSQDTRIYSIDSETFIHTNGPEGISQWEDFVAGNAPWIHMFLRAEDEQNKDENAVIHVAAVAGFAVNVVGLPAMTEEQVFQQLSELKIFVGDPDGNFRAADGLTRAEMAAVCVRLLHQEAQAEEAAGRTPYADVAADHWASGYINLLTERDILKGDETGAFHPDDGMTQAEAVKTLVAMLGYAPAAEQNGGYPTGYLKAGAENGLTEGLAIVEQEPVVRRDVARMVSNALQIPLMEQNEAGEAVIYNGTAEDRPLRTPLSEWLGEKE